MDNFFTPFRDPPYSIDALGHFFMKRGLSGSFNEFLKMDAATREKLYKWELEVIEEENKNNKN